VSSSSLAQRERHALCDLALTLGPDAPTLCGGWDARDLVAHLLVREKRPLGAVGILVPALSALTDREMAKVAEKDFPDLVEEVRRQGLTPYALPVADRLLNTLEYVVHHEDLRRAQPGWEPRVLDQRDEETLWAWLRVGGKALARRTGVALQAQRRGHDGRDSRAMLRRGAPVVTITGAPLELVLYLFGRRDVADVDLDGPPEALATLHAADLGL
jgi:uncharacterized protein (TIGR03085 family)